jgi:hypothetical protein
MLTVWLFVSVTATKFVDRLHLLNVSFALHPQSEEDDYKTFMECYGGLPTDYKENVEKLFGCCGKTPKLSDCPMVASTCKSYGESSKACAAYCDNLSGDKPDWCPSALSVGAIVGIVIGVVALIGIGVGVGIFFYLRSRKNVDGI